MAKTIKAALIQHACAGSCNFNSTLQGLEEAASQGAQLALLQEMHNTHYFCQTEDPVFFDLAETIPGPTTQRLSEKAIALNLVIVASVFERRAPGLYHNSAVVIENDGTLAGIYRKMHIPDDPGYYEKYYFAPGDCGFQPIATSLGQLGVLICWDQWFPEAARLMALAGAEILLYPTAIGWDENDSSIDRQRQLQAWKTVQCAHAITNGLPVLCCNRTGFETGPSGRGIRFWGNSFATGPFGETVAQAVTDGRETVVVPIDLGETEQIRRAWPFLRDRRIDAYAGLNQRYAKRPLIG